MVIGGTRLNNLLYRRAGLRDRALIALMVFSFARIGAALGMKVEDVFTQVTGFMVNLVQFRLADVTSVESVTVVCLGLIDDVLNSGSYQPGS